MIDAVINGAKYQLTYVFNLVGNYYFTRKGVAYLVDAEDVSTWAEDNGKVFFDKFGAAIAYAQNLAKESEDGVFWWKTKRLET